MSFVAIGIITLIAGLIFVRYGMKAESKEILIGAIALIIASLILIVIFGFFYRGITLSF
jgi:hypothetical protein